MRKHETKIPAVFNILDSIRTELSSVPGHIGDDIAISINLGDIHLTDKGRDEYIFALLAIRNEKALMTEVILQNEKAQTIGFLSGYCLSFFEAIADTEYYSTFFEEESPKLSEGYQAFLKYVKRKAPVDATGKNDFTDDRFKDLRNEGIFFLFREFHVQSKYRHCGLAKYMLEVLKAAAGDFIGIGTIPDENGYMLEDFYTDNTFNDALPWLSQTIVPEKNESEILKKLGFSSYSPDQNTSKAQFAIKDPTTERGTD